MEKILRCSILIVDDFNNVLVAERGKGKNTITSWGLFGKEIKGKENEESKQQVKVPELKGKTIKEAEKILKENNLELKTDEGINKEEIIKKQIPEKEILVDEGTSIIVHTN